MRTSMTRYGTQSLLAVLFAAAMVLLPACNTVEGAGKDIEATGGAIEDAARDAK